MPGRLQEERRHRMKKVGSEKQMLSVVFVYEPLTPACKAFLFYATVIFILVLPSTPGF